MAVQQRGWGEGWLPEISYWQIQADNGRLADTGRLTDIGRYWQTGRYWRTGRYWQWPGACHHLYWHTGRQDWLVGYQKVRKQEKCQFDANNFYNHLQRVACCLVNLSPSLSILRYAQTVVKLPHHYFSWALFSQDALSYNSSLIKTVIFSLSQLFLCVHPYWNLPQNVKEQANTFLPSN